MKIKFLSFFYFVVLLLTFTFTGCKEKSSRQIESKPLMELSAKDTSDVIKLCSDYLDLLKQQQYEDAIDMLYCIDTLQNINKLSGEQLQNVQRMYRVFPVLEYHLENLEFTTEFDTRVRYSIEFFEKAADDKRPNTTAVYFRPIRKDKQWYLTMYDTATDNRPQNNGRNKNNYMK